MSYLEEFKKEFQDKLGNTRRWDGFCKIIELLNNNPKIKIIEIGCVRTNDGWESDGQSTRVWNWLADKSEEFFVETVDVEKEHLKIAHKNCPLVLTHHQDGIEFLKNKNVSGLGLLFLDAMDFTGPHAIKSWFQHLSMLMACWDRLPSNCIIAVDDCTHDYEGKHVLIDCFFQRLGVQPILKSYISIWRKP